MGNCMRPSKHRQVQEGVDDSDNHQHQHQKEEEMASGLVKENGDDFEKSGSFKIKIVLTKEELEWLLYQLKVNGGKKIEDFLEEIEKGRSSKVKAWKPSLESIKESPEI